MQSARRRITFALSTMNGYGSYGSSEDHQPVMWLRGYPVWAAHFIVLVFVASMFLTTVLMAFQVPQLSTWFPFTSEAVREGQIWRIFTYGFVNPPSLGFVIDMFMIAWFGRELEKFLGRGRFFALYGCLYLLSPLLFTVIGIWFPMGTLVGETGGFALFIAFAALYPNVALLFGILAKWMAAILVGIYTLMHISARNPAELITLWATVGFAYAFVRHEQGHFSLLPKFDLLRKKPKLRVLPDPEPRKMAKAEVARESTMVEVDALLDKIARSGIGSLTAKERARLDAARTQLTKRRS